MVYARCPVARAKEALSSSLAKYGREGEGGVYESVNVVVCPSMAVVQGSAI
jgi:hypothetical protein